jgi:hypothetical protein
MPTIKALIETVLNSVMFCIIVRVVLHTNKTFTLNITYILQREEKPWFHKAEKILSGGYWYAKIADIKLGNI